MARHGLRRACALLVLTTAQAHALPCPPSARLVAGLCIDRLEVSVADYAACAAAGACGPRARRTQCNVDTRRLGRHPANCVDRLQAERYCAWAGGRLPTSDEWQAAARTAMPAVPAGGDLPEGVCWNARGQAVGTCETGSGCDDARLCDMAGNVAEWTSTTVRLPGGADNALVHGGGWIFDPLTYEAELDPAFRRRVDPRARLVDVGFRCVRPAAATR